MSWRSDPSLKRELYKMIDAIGREENDDEQFDEGHHASVAALKNRLKPGRSAEPSKSMGRSVSDASPALMKFSLQIHLPLSKSLDFSIRNANQAGESSSKKTKSAISEMPIANVPRKLFDGLHFYFFPNNDTHPGRRFRIAKTVEHGATWEKTWSKDVTHLIVDRSMNFGQVKAFLGLDSLPVGAVLVDERYPAECLSYRTIIDPLQKQYAVKGFDGPLATAEATLASKAATDPQNIVLERSKTNGFEVSGTKRSRAQYEQPLPDAESSDQSLQLKPAGRAVMTRQPQTQSVATSSLENNPSPVMSAPSFNEELSEAIDEARYLRRIPIDSDDEDPRGSAHSKASDTESGPSSKRPKVDVPNWQKRFQCMQKHTGDNDASPNASTIALLQQMADYYTQMHDQWRPIAYRKAIVQLRNHPTKITTKEDALKLPHIGTRLAEKIEEIVYTNHLRRLDNAQLEPTDQVLQTFMKIYGVGFAQATKFVDQGFKTLEDLRDRAELNENQRVGIQRYEDFNTRIPRAEVEQHSEVVREALQSYSDGFVVRTMGSYRRGADTSGDIDLIITHPDKPIEEIRTVVLDQLVPQLFKQGFLKVGLAVTSRSDGTKWHGASCLPNYVAWRRIDLLLVPHEELGAAMIYFTGNDIFNRSLRLLASRKGMRLNQRGLFKGAVLRGRNREKLSEGTLVEGQDEKKIFGALGVPWRPPEHRIC